MAQYFLAKNFLQTGTLLSNDHDGSTLHAGTKACDYSHPSSSLKYFTAPFDVKVRYWSEESNTLVFESLEPVILANGQTDYVCFTIGHMEKTDFESIYGTQEENGWRSGYNISDENTIFKSKGEIIYYEGNKGISSGAHGHVRIGQGKYVGWKIMPTGNYDITTTNETSTDTGTIYHDEAFFVDDFTWAAGSVLSDYTFITSDNSSEEETPELTGYHLYAVNTPFRVRKGPVYGEQLSLVLTGRQADIIGFLPDFQSDGYQWAKVRYGTVEGYAQLDLKTNVYKIRRDTGAPSIYLKATDGVFNVRTTPVNGSIIATVPVGGKAQITSINETYASDGYQWANVNYNYGAIGYSQIDTQYNQLVQE